MQIVFTDVDGALVDARTYSFEPAREALEQLRAAGIPLIICTSKTRAEAEHWRERLGNEEPFIIENGAAILIPEGRFSRPVEGASRREGYDILEYGAPYEELVGALRASSRESGCRVLGFHDMTVADIALRTCLTIRQAEMAKRREYDEPFEIVGSGTHALLRAIEARGYRWTRGGRFYHITGAHDKAMAAARLTQLYRAEFGAIVTMGLGDAHNDSGLLAFVDAPVIVRSQFAAVLKASLPRAEVTEEPGPYGWNEAVLRFVALGGHGRPAAMGSAVTGR